MFKHLLVPTDRSQASEAAIHQGCDLIAMASHGSKDVKGFLLGSETQKVLVHTQKPVLVFR